MNEDDSKTDVRWGPCCFCGEDILPSDTDLCHVTVETALVLGKCGFVMENVSKTEL